MSFFTFPGAGPSTFPQGNPADWFNWANPPGGVRRALALALPNQFGMLAIPNMGPGAVTEVPFPANPAFSGQTFAIAALGLPILPQLGACGCWINANGVVFVRFIAGSGGVSAGNQNVGVVALF